MVRLQYGEVRDVAMIRACRIRRVNLMVVVLGKGVDGVWKLCAV